MLQCSQKILEIYAMEKENQRVAISKRLLKEALLSLLKEKKIDKISITELCKKAEINRATFYRHYNVPQDVLTDIELEIIGKAQNIAPLPTTVKGALPYLEQLFTFAYDNADIVRILIANDADTHFSHLLDSCNNSILQEKLHLLNGDLLDKDSVKLLAAYLGGGGYHLIKAWLMDDMPKTPQEIAKIIFNLIIRDLDAYRIG